MIQWEEKQSTIRDISLQILYINIDCVHQFAFIETWLFVLEEMKA